MHLSINLLEYPLDKSISLSFQFQSKTWIYQRLRKNNDVRAYKPGQICVQMVLK